MLLFMYNTLINIYLLKYKKYNYKYLQTSRAKFFSKFKE